MSGGYYMPTHYRVPQLTEAEQDALRAEAEIESDPEGNKPQLVTLPKNEQTEFVKPTRLVATYSAIERTRQTLRILRKIEEVGYFCSVQHAPKIDRLIVNYQINNLRNNLRIRRANYHARDAQYAEGAAYDDAIVSYEAMLERQLGEKDKAARALNVERLRILNLNLRAMKIIEKNGKLIPCENFTHRNLIAIQIILKKMALTGAIIKCTYIKGLSTSKKQTYKIGDCQICTDEIAKIENNIAEIEELI